MLRCHSSYSHPVDGLVRTVFGGCGEWCLPDDRRRQLWFDNGSLGAQNISLLKWNAALLYDENKRQMKTKQQQKTHNTNIGFIRRPHHLAADLEETKKKLSLDLFSFEHINSEMSVFGAAL